MSSPDPAALESILPEVHDIFSERAAEKDLATIKKVKKIEADTRQIVVNRESEIKEVVRAMAQRVEKEENAAENDEELRDVADRLTLAAEEKRQLQTQIEDMTGDKENMLTQVQAMRTDIAQIHLKQKHIDKEVSKELPQNKGLLHLYHNISKIRWDGECADEKRWKGIIIPEAHEADLTPKEFDVDTSAMSDFDACNALWNAIG
jgi:chromosome segregation ATPase